MTITTKRALAACGPTLLSATLIGAVACGRAENHPRGEKSIPHLVNRGADESNEESLFLEADGGSGGGTVRNPPGATLSFVPGRIFYSPLNSIDELVGFEPTPPLTCLEPDYTIEGFLSSLPRGSYDGCTRTWAVKFGENSPEQTIPPGSEFDPMQLQWKVWTLNQYCSDSSVPHPHSISRNQYYIPQVIGNGGKPEDCPTPTPEPTPDATPEPTVTPEPTPTPPPQCPIKPVKEPTDEASQRLLNGNPVDLSNLEPELNVARQCLIERIRAQGGRIQTTSGFRPASYQQYLREVWDKNLYRRKNASRQECESTYDDIKSRMKKHGLKFEPAGLSQHNTSPARAFDASITGLPYGPSQNGGNLSDEIIDNIAAQCGLFRPIKKDPVHFERIGNRNQ